MRLLTRDMVDAYMRDDEILRLLDAHRAGDDDSFTTQRWLRESAPKRSIFQSIYGDLLRESARRLKILDVGGGYTSLSRVLARGHEYSLLDIMSNDSGEAVRVVEQELQRPFLVQRDWLAYSDEAGEYDVIVANDLFPNVDQRLQCFLERYLPRCREMRLSLTIYNTPRWYEVKRVDGDEVFHMLAWDGRRTGTVLSPYCADENDLAALLQNPPSLYPNGRQVCLLRLTGGRNR